MYIKSFSSRIIHNVLIARLSVEVYATSNENPSVFKSWAPLFASFRPASLNGQSYHPVNLFSSFHVLSPCRTNTTVYFISKHDCERNPDKLKFLDPERSIQEKNEEAGISATVNDMTHSFNRTQWKRWDLTYPLFDSLVPKNDGANADTEDKKRSREAKDLISFFCLVIYFFDVETIFYYFFIWYLIRHHTISIDNSTLFYFSVHNARPLYHGKSLLTW